MLKSLLASLASKGSTKSIRRLHIGGTQAKEGWEIFNAVPAPVVDHLGNARDLSRFDNFTFSEIYASHILEHLDYKDELPNALNEWKRVLAPGGTLYISVPDIATLAEMFCDSSLDVSARFHVMRMIFGGHVDAYDYHQTGFDFEILTHFLRQAGFSSIQRVGSFGLFDDCSDLHYLSRAISLNVMANYDL